MKNKIYLFIFSLVLTLSLGSFERVFAQISGKVVDSNGNAVKEIIVELIPAEFKTKPTRYDISDDLTDENGLFKFEDIKEGQYILAIGYVWTPDIDDPYPTNFYPSGREKSQAIIFEVKPDNLEQNIIFQLPEKLAELTIKGKILFADGKPAVNVHVRLHNEESQLVVSDCRTDKNGNFFLKGFVGGKYHIEADNYTMMSNNWDSASSKTFTLNDSIKGFRLVLKSVKEKSVK